MVFYRKYRPQKISELDSGEVRERLTPVVAGRQIPHAFLLNGPKGLGKTSAARIIAKIVNCERLRGGALRVEKATSHEPRATSSVEPCNKCDQCVSITKGAHVDILEIDAASNRGIDEIRDLREKITFAPASAAKKVYIIDEVHMLTSEAFNALLKTLEEPPPHAMFILATTDLHKVPQTIQSRCFPIPFSKASNDELIRSLTRVVKGENIAIDKEAMLTIAKASDGSFRDASKLLELAVLAEGRKKITQAKILALIGKVGDLDAFIQLLKEKELKKALSWVNASVESGVNLKTWIEDLLGLLHTGLLAKYEVGNGPPAGGLTDFSEEEIKKLIRLFSLAYGEGKTAVIPQLPLELAIIEYCMGGDN